MARLSFRIEVDIDESNIVESSLEADGFVALLDQIAQQKAQEILVRAIGGEVSTPSPLPRVTGDAIRRKCEAVLAQLPRSFS